MRLLCDGLPWFHTGGSIAADLHDVVCVDSQSIRAMWTRPRPDWWRDAAPPGWEPDVALFGWPEYNLIPPYLAELPCPVALWIGDWYANAQAAHWLADQAELILADATGVRALRRSGIENVEEFCAWTFDPELHRADCEAEPEFDIGFAGNFNDAIQFQRNRLLWRVARMDERWRIRLTSGVHGQDYARFLQRSRITFNYSVTGDINMRCFEAAACGSLVTINRTAAAEVDRWFELGREIVVYDDDNMEDVLEHYLSKEDERKTIARAGWERVQAHSHAERLAPLLERLETLAKGGRTIRQPRNRARDGARSVSHLLSTLACPTLEGAERLLEEAEGAVPDEAGLQLSRAVMYTRHGVDHPDQMRDANMWAEEHFARATQLDPTDATAWLAYLEFEELGGGTRTTEFADRIIAGIRDGTLVARADRQLLSHAVTTDGILWQRSILEQSDPDTALTRHVLVRALGAAARAEPDLSRRVDLLQEAVTVSGAQPQRVWALAAALLIGHRFADALPWFQVFYSQRPLSAEVWFPLAALLAALERGEEALAVIEACSIASKRLPMEPAIMPRIHELDAKLRERADMTVEPLAAV